MSAWGHAPWDGDAAADWYGDLFEKFPLGTEVEAALMLDPEESADEIRAAAALLIMLGRTYIWPINDIDRHLKLAIEQMEKVHAIYVADDEPEFATAVAEEIAVLKSRHENAKDSPTIPQPKSWGAFWS